MPNLSPEHRARIERLHTASFAVSREIRKLSVDLYAAGFRFPDLLDTTLRDIESEFMRISALLYPEHLAQDNPGQQRPEGSGAQAST